MQDTTGSQDHERALRDEAQVVRRGDWRQRDISITVGPGDGPGMRLDRYLAAVLWSYSRTLVKRWLDRGYGTTNGRPAKPGQRIRAGDRIRLIIPHPPPPPGQQIKPGPLAVLHDADGILVLNKPVGQLSHPAGRVLQGTLLNQIQELLTARGVMPEEARLVNRIDRDTSGIVLATTDATIHAALSHHLQHGGFSKEYLAICHGVPPDPTGHWRDPIVQPDAKQTIARHCADDGAPSHTEYEVLEATHTGRYSLLRLHLHTGRQHQIRVHAAHHGHPLVGDWTYGAPCVELVGQALHAARLGFTDPTTQARITVEAPLIGTLEALWERLAAGGDITPRDLTTSEVRRLGERAPARYRRAAGGLRKPGWMGEEEFRGLASEDSGETGSAG